MKAVVLCAGFGTRLGDLTREIPKPMLDIQGKPLLAYLLGHLRPEGIADIAINLHFRPEVIREWFGDGSRWGLRIRYSPEEQLLGTAGAVRNLEPSLRDEDAFLVQYGDVLTDQPIAPLLRCHREHGALATLLVHRRKRSNSVVTVDDTGRVIGFLERPADPDLAPLDSCWVNSGMFLCSGEILDLIPKGRPSDFPRDVFVPLVATGRLYAVPLEGYRCAIDSPERLAEARARLERDDAACSLSRINPRGHVGGGMAGAKS